ncbi:MAG: hypothetical protein R3E08_11160 [Thiotrichaceae bacterium]
MRCRSAVAKFVEESPGNQPLAINDGMIDKLLLERMSLAGIVRVTGVSSSWLQNYVNEKYKQIPCEVVVSKKSKWRLTLECDEMWSFVQSFEIQSARS